MAFNVTYLTSALIAPSPNNLELAMSDATYFKLMRLAPTANDTEYAREIAMCCHCLPDVLFIDRSPGEETQREIDRVLCLGASVQLLCNDTNDSIKECEHHVN